MENHTHLNLARMILGPDTPIFVTQSEVYSSPEPDHCTCNTTGGTWTLEADGSGIGLQHDACGKPLLHDYLERVTCGRPFVVTLTPEVDNCQCRGRCDCTVWLTMKGV